MKIIPQKLDLLHFTLMGLLIVICFLWLQTGPSPQPDNLVDTPAAKQDTSSVAAPLENTPPSNQSNLPGHSNEEEEEGNNQPIDRASPDDQDEITEEHLISDLHKVTDIVQGVLKFTNFEGAEVNYIGEIKEKQANGFGFAIFEKKGFYEGEWADNKRNGKGVYYWQNGDQYEGEYVNGHREGYGVYTFATGEAYLGYWKDDLRNGEGTLTDKNGTVVSKNLWKEDKPVPNRKSKKKKK